MKWIPTRYWSARGYVQSPDGLTLVDDFGQHVAFVQSNDGARSWTAFAGVDAGGVAFGTFDTLENAQAACVRKCISA